MPEESLPPVYDGLTDAEITRGIGNQLFAIGDRRPGGKGREHWLARELAWLESKRTTPEQAIETFREWKANVDLQCENSAAIGTANGFGIHASGPSALDVMAGRASVADTEAHERRKDAAAERELQQREREIRAAELERREAALEGDAAAEAVPAAGGASKLSLDTRAVALFIAHRDWSKARIAEELGVSPSNLRPSRCPTLDAAMRAERSNIDPDRRRIRGTKSEGSLEAWDESGD